MFNKTHGPLGREKKHDIVTCSPRFALSDFQNLNKVTVVKWKDVVHTVDQHEVSEK